LHRAPNTVATHRRGRCRHYILTCRRPLAAPLQRPADRESRSITSAFHVQLSCRRGGSSPGRPSPPTPVRVNGEPVDDSPRAYRRRPPARNNFPPLCANRSARATARRRHPTRRVDPSAPRAMRVHKTSIVRRT